MLYKYTYTVSNEYATLRTDGIFIRATRSSPGTDLHVDPIRHATINELSYFPFIITANGISVSGL